MEGQEEYFLLTWLRPRSAAELCSTGTLVWLIGKASSSNLSVLLSEDTA